MELRVLASLLLLLAILARIPAVLQPPKNMKKKLGELSKISRNWQYAFSFVLLATGLILISIVVRSASLSAVVVTTFGVGLLAGSFIVYNGLHKDILKAFMKRPDKWVQKIAVLKIVVAAIILYLISSSILI